MGVRENIIRLRNLSGLTQEQFAEVAGVSRAAVSLWEIGRSEPRMGAVQNLADYFSIKKSNIIEDGGMDNIAVTIGGKMYEREQSKPILSDEEMMLVELYRHANAQGKASIMAIARVSS